MFFNSGRFGFMALAVQILLQATIIECKPGFFSSMAGAAAGSAIGKLISDHKTKHHQTYHGTPVTTVERRETLANGCYKQVVKEPDTYNPGRFIETEQLICPQTLPAQIPATLPVQPSSSFGMQTLVPNGSVPMQPMMPSVIPQQVTVLSKRTGSYYSSGQNLVSTGALALIALALVVYFI